MTEAFKAKVVLVGPPGVGKTSLVRRFVLQTYEDAYRATLGANVYKWSGPVDVDGRAVRVTMGLWDTTGEAGLSEGRRDVYAHGAQGVLAVCDVTDGETVPALAPWIDGALRVAGDMPVQILLNKADLGPREDAQTAALREARVRGAPAYRTSARTGDNVAAAFEALARRIVERALVPADGPLDDADFGLALACHRGRTAEEIASLQGMALLAAEARLDRLRRRGYVRLASVTLNSAGCPQITYEATSLAFLEPLRAARR